ncbi:glycosyltransferase family 2 protein [Conservatibacter flavescens]|uniref:Amylovoran biosynthesis protein AmsE n=1 Tax=Conservatibacter flavescens TaxID=28161 RepID=A0A2M8S271_9PAST|nr:glycosyltransferase [Conservatibacter flavescens]PJG85227.1 amylovoran biosynthesis protein AmsE [Conservatibacter flavescens]
MNFSVLMSLYYKEKAVFLAQCFDSLLQQTIKATEIVLVFDGEIGTELEKTVEKYTALLPLKIVRLPQNVGLGKALNAGIEQCSYEWIFRMDTDDFCHPERFAKQVAYIQQNPEVDIVGTQLAEFESDPDVLTGERKVPTSAVEIAKFSKTRSPFNHPTVAYRKSMLLALGGYQHHLYLEDYNLWLRILANGYHAANLPEILLYMRVGNGMVGRRKGWAYFKSEWQLAQLKRSLNYDNSIVIFSQFLLRGAVRLLPTTVLTAIYKKLHK